MSDIETVVIILLVLVIIVYIIILMLEYSKDIDFKMKEDCIEQGFTYLSNNGYLFKQCYYINNYGAKVYLNYDTNRGIWHAN